MTRAELEQIAREAAAQYNLPVDVFLRLIDQESEFKVNALSPKGALGPAQLMPDTAAELGVNREDPRENIFGGAKYLRQQLDRFGEMPMALAAYNAGPTRVARLGRIPNIPETQNYIKAILGSTDGQPLSATRNDAMVGNMQTPPIFPQQKQQQQGGLRGLLSGFMQPNQTTGLTGPENFAAALDALILPQARMGEQIRARGAQRMQTQSRNKTIETLKQRAAQGDNLAKMVLEGLESGAYDAKTAMSLYMGKMLETPKKTETFTTATGAQLNEQFGTDLDPSKMYNVSSSGKITQVGGGGVTIEGDKGVDEFAKQDAKTLSETFSTGVSAASNLNKINRLDSLLQNVETGSMAALKNVMGNFGIETEGLGDIQAAQALINAMVPAQRPAGSGPMSDADLELFKQSLPRLINQPRGNEIIIATLRGIAQYDAMGAEIVQKYRTGELSKAEAFQQLMARPDPFSSSVDPTSYLPQP